MTNIIVVIDDALEKVSYVLIDTFCEEEKKSPPIIMFEEKASPMIKILLEKASHVLIAMFREEAKKLPVIKFYY